MADLTYTCEKVTDWNETEAPINIMLPQENPNDPYFFEPMYNVSKSTLSRHYNAILIIMRKERSNKDPLQAGTADRHHLTVDFGKLINYPGSEPLDPEQDILFIVFHDDAPSINNTNLLFNTVESMTDDVIKNGPGSIRLPNNKKLYIRAKPRKVGMSVLIKAK